MEKKYLSDRRNFIYCLGLAAIMLIIAVCSSAVYPDDESGVMAIFFVGFAAVMVVVAAINAYWPVVESDRLILKNCLFRFLEREYRFSDIEYAKVFLETGNTAYVKICIKTKDGRMVSRPILTSRLQIGDVNADLNSKGVPGSPVAGTPVGKGERKYVSKGMLWIVPGFFWTIAAAAGVAAYFQGDCSIWLGCLLFALMAGLFMFMSNYVVLSERLLTIENFYFSPRSIVVPVNEIASVSITSDKSYYHMTVLLKPKGEGAVPVEYSRILAVLPKQADQLKLDLMSIGIDVM